MTDTPMGRDLIPPVPPPDEPVTPDGFMLGIDLEELYFFVGEGFRGHQYGLGLDVGLPAASYTHKLDRIRTTLWSLPDGINLVRQIDDILGQISTGTNAAIDVESFREENERLEHLLDGVLHTVRHALPDDAGHWYDLGVFLARLHMCLEILESPPIDVLKQSHETYLLELRRVLPQFVGAFIRLVQYPSTDAPPAPLARALVVLARDMAAFDHEPTNWYSIARKHADEVFTAIGMTHSGTSPLLVIARAADGHQDEPPAEKADPLVELGRQLAHHREVLYRNNDPEGAEEGLRTLLVTTRRTLGPDHPLVFMIQSDLSIVLLLLGRAPLCVELALDATDEAALHLGDRHPVTAAVANRTLLTLVGTGRTEEAAMFLHSRLAWLLDAEVDNLSKELRIARDELLHILITDKPEASS
jgi:hypothetical protein